ncbi:MAG: hypothetical protein RLZZ502_1750, partial [Pseudomonadota bacterium]|jgi:pimeloyl-ACP methyl ester carboxylesterase
MNPWVHQESSHNQAIVTKYYSAQLLSTTFWLRLLRGEVKMAAALLEAFTRVTKLLTTPKQSAAHVPGAPSRPQPEALDFVARMRQGWQNKACPTLVILSGQDITADEFRLRSAQAEWAALMHSAQIQVRELPEANHTFSRSDWRAQVIGHSIAWLHALPPLPSLPSMHPQPSSHA